MTAIDRREFLLLLLATVTSTAHLLGARPALADNDGGDDGGDGGDDGGDGGGGGDDGDGGGDDGGGDDSGSGDDKGESEDGDGNGSSESDDDHIEARDAVREGRILPLREILQRVAAMRAGRVLSVDLSLKSKTPVYVLKVENEKGGVRTLRLNAETGRTLGLFGWW